MVDYEEANAIRRGFRLIKITQEPKFSLINFMMFGFLVALVITAVGLIFQ